MPQAQIQPERELVPSEILHIDAIKSQDFFEKFNSDEQEKHDCQRMVFDLFTKCCQAHDGFVARNWAGDGGHAFFPANRKSGNSVWAARDFIAELPSLALQTASILGKRATLETARRKFRIKGHFGLIYLSGDAKLDSGSAGAFDAFLKHERELAPLADELFITDALLTRLGGAVRDQFVKHREAKKYGLLTTALYRLKTPPLKFPKISVADGEMTGGERLFLRSQVDSLSLITSARNLITSGLMSDLIERKSAEFLPQTLRDLTIRGIHHYLKADNPFQEFTIALWRLAGTKLVKVAAYPATERFIDREVEAEDIRFQVARTFSLRSPMITQDVVESRMQGEWMDFDETQAEPSRCLHSAIQLPIYRATNKVGSFTHKQVMGILSVDCDKPGFFQIELLDLWRNNLTGFLVNLALAELMHQLGIRNQAIGTQQD